MQESDRPPRFQKPFYIGDEDQNDYDNDHGHLHYRHRHDDSNSDSNTGIDSKGQRHHHRRHHHPRRQWDRSRVSTTTTTTATATTAATAADVAATDTEEHSSASQQYHQRRQKWRDSWAQREGQGQWSPWSRWRVILKLLYAVAVPAVIIYLLLQVEHSLQGRDGDGAGAGAGAAPTAVRALSRGRSTSPPPPLPSWSSLGRVGGATKSQWSWLAFLGSRRHGGHGHGDGPRSDESSPSSESHLHLLTSTHQDQDQDQQQHHQQLRGPEQNMVQQTFFDSFLLFGDSITQCSFNIDDRGFGALLAQLFQRRLDVINRGFSGYNTEQAIHLLPQFLPRTTPPQEQDKQSPSSSSSPLQSPPTIQFLTIFFGANDACLSPSRQHVDMDRYGNNIRTLIEMVHNPNSTTYSPQTKIIVICPPPIDETRWAAYRQWQGQAMDRNKDVTRQYSETCLKIGQEYEAKNSVQSSPHHCQVNVIDTWGVMSKRIESGQQSLRDYLSDGVHLTAKGNNLIFEQIMNVVRHRYPEWDPETMLMHGPWWANLDLKNPEVDLLVCANKVRP